VLTLDVAVLAQSLEKALDQKRSALARADGQKTDPGYFRGLLAGRLAARQKAETGQGHAALQELATAIAVHAGCPGPRVSRAAHYDAREASSCGRVKLESSSAGRRAPSALAFLREFELGRLRDRQIGGVGALQDLVDEVDRQAALRTGEARRVRASLALTARRSSTGSRPSRRPALPEGRSPLRLADGPIHTAPASRTGPGWRSTACRPSIARRP